MQDLHRILGALLKTSERATRLLASGSGSSRGLPPAWLRKSTDFVVTGLSQGSTIIEIDAPRLADVAEEAFAQTDFWIAQPSVEDTALDLAAEAILEAENVNSTGERFDASVLDSILEFKKAVRSSGATFELRRPGKKAKPVSLTADAYTTIDSRKSQLPSPQAFILSGKLDEIRHSGGRFQLLFKDSQALPGRIHAEFLDEESLRPCWGRNVTIEGTVFFKANGKPRAIEARSIAPFAEGDEVFESIPQSHPGTQDLLFPEFISDARRADPMKLWGAWPGDEPLEELIAELNH
jgi:hypothetical protein